MSTELQLSTWESSSAPPENLSLDKKNAAVKIRVNVPDLLTCVCKAVVWVPMGLAVHVLLCGGSFAAYFLRHS